MWFLSINKLDACDLSERREEDFNHNILKMANILNILSSGYLNVKFENTKTNTILRRRMHR